MNKLLKDHIYKDVYGKDWLFAGHKDYLELSSVIDDRWTCTHSKRDIWFSWHGGWYLNYDLDPPIIPTPFVPESFIQISTEELLNRVKHIIITQYKYRFKYNIPSRYALVVLTLGDTGVVISPEVKVISAIKDKLVVKIVIDD
jgi:hypothetical protein